MKARKITQKELQKLDSWERFLEKHHGAYPATLAAIKLSMTTAGVYAAAQRGWLTYFQIGRDRWYSRKEVMLYRSKVARNFHDNRPHPGDSPKNFFGAENPGSDHPWH